jgi:hypothetical protein
VLLPCRRPESEPLRKIGEALLRHEVAIGWARGRRNQLPIPLPENEAREPSELAKAMLEFDDVDRNIVRELSVRFIDMAQEAVEAGRLERASQGEGAAGVEASRGSDHDK